MGNWGDCVVNGVATLACVPRVFALVINAAILFVGTVSVIALMYAGIRMILARGDAKELETAHKQFFYALLGILIVLLSFLLVNIIGYITGISCINQFGFNNCAAK